MYRSARIVAPLLAAAAVSVLTGCRPKEMQRCVDENNTVVDDKLCANQPANLSGQGVQQQRPDGHGGFIPFILPYRYYYGGGGGFGLGSRVSGGGYAPQANQSYRMSNGSTGYRGGGFFRGITRGGFGSHFGGGGG